MLKDEETPSARSKMNELVTRASTEATPDSPPAPKTCASTGIPALRYCSNQTCGPLENFALVATTPCA